MKAANQTLQYHIDETSELNFHNWYTRLQLECVPFSEYAQVGAAYFVGYGFGIVFLFLPDLLGRRGCMALVLPLYCLVTTLAVMSDDLWMKKIGFFLQGFIHIKISNTFTSIYEFVPEAGKIPCLTLITCYDSCTLLIVCSAIKFAGASFQQVAEVQLYVGIVASALYLLIAPESPQWYFLKDGPRSKRGIQSLNYIAWFNGSSSRVPEGAVFDLIG